MEVEVGVEAEETEQEGRRWRWRCRRKIRLVPVEGFYSKRLANTSTERGARRV